MLALHLVFNRNTGDRSNRFIEGDSGQSPLRFPKLSRQVCAFGDAGELASGCQAINT